MRQASHARRGGRQRQGRRAGRRRGVGRRRPQRPGRRRGHGADGGVDPGNLRPGGAVAGHCRSHGAGGAGRAGWHRRPRRIRPADRRDLERSALLRERTNLLALNATIEAARAGEAAGLRGRRRRGQGFVRTDGPGSGRDRPTDRPRPGGHRRRGRSDRRHGRQDRTVRDFTQSVALSVGQQDEAMREIAQNITLAADRSDSAAQNVEAVKQTAESAAAEARRLSGVSRGFGRRGLAHRRGDGTLRRSGAERSAGAAQVLAPKRADARRGRIRRRDTSASGRRRQPRRNASRGLRLKARREPEDRNRGRAGPGAGRLGSGRQGQGRVSSALRGDAPARRGRLSCGFIDAAWPCRASCPWAFQTRAGPGPPSPPGPIRSTRRLSPPGRRSPKGFRHLAGDLDLRPRETRIAPISRVVTPPLRQIMGSIHFGSAFLLRPMSRRNQTAPAACPRRAGLSRGPESSGRDARIGDFLGLRQAGAQQAGQRGGDFGPRSASSSVAISFSSSADRPGRRLCGPCARGRAGRCRRRWAARPLGLDIGLRDQHFRATPRLGRHQQDADALAPGAAGAARAVLQHFGVVRAGRRGSPGRGRGCRCRARRRRWRRRPAPGRRAAPAARGCARVWLSSPDRATTLKPRSTRLACSLPHRLARAQKTRAAPASKKRSTLTIACSISLRRDADGAVVDVAVRRLRRAHHRCAGRRAGRRRPGRRSAWAGWRRTAGCGARPAWRRGSPPAPRGSRGRASRRPRRG